MAEQIYTPDIADKLADMFSDGSSITKVAAVKLGICRATYYEWKELHPEFKKAANRAEQLSEAFHEDLLMSGIQGEVDGFNATGQIFSMKNRFRETYGEQKQAPNALSAIETLLNIMHDKPAK